MKLFRNVKASTSASISGLALIAILCVSTGFLEAAPAVAKAPAKTQPVVLAGSAIAVPDSYSADAAEQLFNEGGNAIDAAAAIAFTLAVTFPGS
ncbi:gamma-glutamyltranspeptidase [Paraburkholderia sp. WSM4175]